MWRAEPVKDTGSIWNSLRPDIPKTGMAGDAYLEQLMLISLILFIGTANLLGLP
jgi:hypothetical protein